MYTVRFAHNWAAPFFVLQMAQYSHEAFLPKHFLQKYHTDYVSKEALDQLVKEAGVDTWANLFLNAAARDGSLDLPVLCAWDQVGESQEGANYARNPYYWKVDTEGNQLPYIDTVSTRVAANVEAAQMMAFSGEAELQTFSTGQYPADTMILKTNEELGDYKVLTSPIGTPNVLVFAFNITHSDPAMREIFADRRFRIAMSIGFNREDIRSIVYLDQPVESRQNAPLRESKWYHEAAALNYVEYDPDRANALLNEMGLTARDSDGFRLRLDGESLAITMEVMSQRDDYVDALEMMSQMWEKIGVRTAVKPVQVGLYNQRITANEHDAGPHYGGGGGINAPLAPDKFIPITNRTIWAPLWGKWYTSGGEAGEEPPANVKRQLELYDQLLTTADETKQLEMWAEIMDVNAEECFHFGICDRAGVPTVVSNKFRNVPETGWNMHNFPATMPFQYWKEG